MPPLVNLKSVKGFTPLAYKPPEPIAKTESATNAWIVHDDVRTKLTKGRTVYYGDRIKTEENGRARFVMRNGEFVSVEPDTEFLMEEFRMKNGNAACSTAIGIARALTKKIEETNPEGFPKIVPQAVCGFRG